jgi:hypothetical protein
MKLRLTAEAFTAKIAKNSREGRKGKHHRKISQKQIPPFGRNDKSSGNKCRFLARFRRASAAASGSE